MRFDFRRPAPPRYETADTSKLGLERLKTAQLDESLEEARAAMMQAMAEDEARAEEEALSPTGDRFEDEPTPLPFSQQRCS